MYAAWVCLYLCLGPYVRNSGSCWKTDSLIMIYYQTSERIIADIYMLYQGYCLALSCQRSENDDPPTYHSTLRCWSDCRLHKRVSGNSYWPIVLFSPLSFFLSFLQCFLLIIVKIMLRWSIRKCHFHLWEWWPKQYYGACKRTVNFLWT